jgi:ABC-2 type transport system permease protein
MSDAVIYDRGYRSYEGVLLGRSSIRRAIIGDGIRRILGLRRKARRKILPWGLLALGVIMAAVLIGLQYVAGSIAQAVAQGLPSYPELFDAYSRVSLLFLAVTVPELLGPDRAQGVLSVYFSRPMTVLDYLGSKAIAYLAMASSIYLVPQLAFHIGQAGLSDDGFLSYLGSSLDIVWKVVVVTAAFVVVHGGVLALISSYIDRTAFAAATFLGVLVAGGNLASVISEASFPGARWAALFAFDGHARTIRDWLFDVDLSTNAPEAAGFSPWLSVTSVAAVGIIGALWTYRRYRRLA